MRSFFVCRTLVNQVAVGEWMVHWRDGTKSKHPLKELKPAPGPGKRTVVEDDLVSLLKYCRGGDECVLEVIVGGEEDGSGDDGGDEEDGSGDDGGDEEDGVDWKSLTMEMPARVRTRLPTIIKDIAPQATCARIFIVGFCCV